MNTWNPQTDVVDVNYKVIEYPEAVSRVNSNTLVGIGVLVCLIALVVERFIPLSDKVVIEQCASFKPDQSLSNRNDKNDVENIQNAPLPRLEVSPFEKAHVGQVASDLPLPPSGSGRSNASSLAPPSRLQQKSEVNRPMANENVSMDQQQVDGIAEFSLGPNARHSR